MGNTVNRTSNYHYHKAPEGKKKPSGDSDNGKKSYSKKSIWDRDRESRAKSSSGSSFKNSIAKSWGGSDGGSDRGMTLKEGLGKASKWIGNKLNYEINAISQGGEGNCGLLSAIAGIGLRSDIKSILKSTIKKVGNVFKVTFKGAAKGTLGSKSKPITVTQAAVANDSTKRRNPKSDLEAAILNCAVHIREGIHAYNPGRMLQLLTGKKVRSTKNLAELAKVFKNRKTSGVAWWGNHAWGMVNGKGAVLNPHNTSKLESGNLANTVTCYYTIG